MMGVATPARAAMKEVDSSFSAHERGFHSNGAVCGLPNYARAAIRVYVR